MRNKFVQTTLTQDIYLIFLLNFKVCEGLCSYFASSRVYFKTSGIPETDLNSTCRKVIILYLVVDIIGYRMRDVLVSGKIWLHNLMQDSISKLICSQRKKKKNIKKKETTANLIRIGFHYNTTQHNGREKSKTNMKQ